MVTTSAVASVLGWVGTALKRTTFGIHNEENHMEQKQEQERFALNQTWSQKQNDANFKPEVPRDLSQVSSKSQGQIPCSWEVPALWQRKQPQTTIQIVPPSIVRNSPIIEDIEGWINLSWTTCDLGCSPSLKSMILETPFQLDTVHTGCNMRTPISLAPWPIATACYRLRSENMGVWGFFDLIVGPGQVVIYSDISDLTVSNPCISFGSFGPWATRKNRGVFTKADALNKGWLDLSWTSLGAQVEIIISWSQPFGFSLSAMATRLGLLLLLAAWTPYKLLAFQQWDWKKTQRNGT